MAASQHNMSMIERKAIGLEEGWDFIQKKGITKVKNILEGLPEPQFTYEDCMILYTTVYDMCSQRPPHNYGRQLYDKYKEAFEDYIISTVLPSLRHKKDELLLTELLTRWSNHKFMTRRPGRKHPSLAQTSFLSFYYLVYEEINKPVMDAILAMIARKHAGEQIDQALLNNALDFYFKIEETTRENNGKEKKMHGSPTVSSKKFNLVSSDKDAFEVDYDFALMSKSLDDITEAMSVGDVDSISVSLMDAILAMIALKRAGEQIDQLELIFVLDFYLEIEDPTRKNNAKEVQMNGSPTVSSNLISSDGDVFEDDYGVALTSKTLKDIIGTIPVGDVDSISVSLMDAIFTMITRKRAGEQIDQTLLNNALNFYLEIEETTRENNAKEEKMHGSPTVSSKKFNLISSGGDVFEVDYGVALMSKTLKDTIETIPGGDVDSISVSLVSSKILTKVIEYCKKHNSTQMDVDLRDWDVQFVDVDLKTLFGLVKAANYMKIDSLRVLATSKVDDLINGKTPE